MARQNLPTPMNSFDLDSDASFRSNKNSLSMRIKRNLFRFVDWLPFLYIFAIASGMASHERQRLGDRVASTIVTLAPTKDINPPPAPFLFH